MALEPAPTTDGQMGRLETHARHIVGRRPLPGRRNFAQQLREPGVVGPLDLHEIELRALERFPPRVGDRRYVPRVGQEQHALRRDHDDRGGARKIRQIQNVRKRGYDERLELELEQAPADRKQARTKSGGRRLRHGSRRGIPRAPIPCARRGPGRRQVVETRGRPAVWRRRPWRTGRSLQPGVSDRRPSPRDRDRWEQGTRPSRTGASAAGRLPPRSWISPRPRMADRFSGAPASTVSNSSRAASSSPSSTSARPSVTRADRYPGWTCQARAAHLHCLGEQPGAAVFLGQLRKSNRRRVLLNPASQVVDSRIVGHVRPSIIRRLIDACRRVLARWPRSSVTVSVTEYVPAASPIVVLGGARVEVVGGSVAPVPRVVHDAAAGHRVRAARVEGDVGRRRDARGSGHSVKNATGAPGVLVTGTTRRMSADVDCRRLLDSCRPG